MLAPAWEGHQGDAAACVRGGTTVALSPTEHTSLQWLGTNDAGNCSLKTQTSAYNRKYQLAHLLSLFGKAHLHKEEDPPPFPILHCAGVMEHNEETEDKYLPLYAATLTKPNAAIVELLLHHGARADVPVFVRYKDMFGWTVQPHSLLKLALRNSIDSAIIKLLLEHDALSKLDEKVHHTHMQK